jgi:hypothetical protein
MKQLKSLLSRRKKREAREGDEEMNRKKSLLIVITFVMVMIIFNLMLSETLSGSIKTIKKESSQDYENSPFGFHPALPYEDANYIGIKWTRGGSAPYVFWSLVDPNMTGDPGKFQWKGEAIDSDGNKKRFNYDNLILANEAGLYLLHNIDIQPRHHQDGYEKPGSWLPLDEKAYRTFVRETVKRYSFIRYWQIGNEPAENPRKSDYGKFLLISYEAVKEGNPEAKVLIGGVAGMSMPHTITEYISNFNDRFLPLLEDVAVQNKRTFDIFDYHWYGNATGDYKISKDIYNYILQKINELRIPTPEEYWITEMGTYSGDPSPIVLNNKLMKDWLYQSEKQQAIDLVKRNVCPLSFGVEKIFMAFGLTEGFKHDNGYFDHTGLIYDGHDSNDLGQGIRKLGYYTYKLMTEKLEDPDWDNIQTIQELDDIYIYKFTKNGEPIWVAWWDYFDDTGNSKKITIDIGNINSVKITEAVPKLLLILAILIRLK